MTGPLRNCWTCRHDCDDGYGCRVIFGNRAIRAWTNATLPPEGRCPTDADGCPGYEPSPASPHAPPGGQEPASAGDPAAQRLETLEQVLVAVRLALPADLLPDAPLAERVRALVRERHEANAYEAELRAVRTTLAPALDLGDGEGEAAADLAGAVMILLRSVVRERDEAREAVATLKAQREELEAARGGEGGEALRKLRSGLTAALGVGGTDEVLLEIVREIVEDERKAAAEQRAAAPDTDTARALLWDYVASCVAVNLPPDELAFRALRVLEGR